MVAHHIGVSRHLSKLSLTRCSSFVLIVLAANSEQTMPTLDYLRSEVERMRVQVGRQRKEILTLQRAGIPTASAEALLQRMRDKIDALCAQRDALKKDLPKKSKVLGGRSW